MTDIKAGLSARDVIAWLGLKPHPEGGHYRETFRDPQTVDDSRAASTAIYFLLAAVNDRTGTASMRRRSGITTRAVH